MKILNLLKYFTNWQVAAHLGVCVLSALICSLHFPMNQAACGLSHTSLNNPSGNLWPLRENVYSQLATRLQGAAPKTSLVSGCHEPEKSELQRGKALVWEKATHINNMLFWVCM